MTGRECAIVEAYTGMAMCCGENRDEFYKYVEELFSRPVYTHEMGELADEIKARSKEDFVKLCKEAEWGRSERLCVGDIIVCKEDRWDDNAERYLVIKASSNFYVCVSGYDFSILSMADNAVKDYTVIDRTKYIQYIRDALHTKKGQTS